jgi:hypothetical protein
VTFLFVVIVVVAVGLIAFLIYAGGALLSRPKQPPPITRVQYLQLPTMPSLPPAPPPTRIARGTTPQPIAADRTDTAPFVMGEPTPPIPGVISNRDDATERTVQADDRFSVRRSSKPRY